MGAILASGILDAGGRNVTISLRSHSGYDRLTAMVGTALFTQYWYWFPLLHFLSLSFTPTALIGLQKDLKAPKFDFVSECNPALFAYPSAAAVIASSATVKAPVAVLSTAARAKGRKKEAEAKGGVAAAEAAAGEKAEGAADVKKEEEGTKKADADAMEVEGADGSAAAAEKKAPEPTSEILHNPARVLPAQEKYIRFPDSCRYTPIRKASSGFVLLKDKEPGLPEEYALTDGPGSAASAARTTAAVAAAAAAAAAPAAAPGAFRRSGGGGGATGRGRGGAAPPPPPRPAADDDEDEPAPPDAFDFH
eukprot:TRINITY_DN5735_c1_g2_i2.p1 TRINITY_DN5735_c1_g2~~TRINITY_DN5735_c1_g2_i2.p1  ORF type:complete len:358 (-),score=35.24 TRINITY_DN5735_c1_g2_i2:163-1083(-)